GPARVATALADGRRPAPGDAPRRRRDARDPPLRDAGRVARPDLRRLPPRDVAPRAGPRGVAGGDRGDAAGEGLPGMARGTGPRSAECGPPRRPDRPALAAPPHLPAPALRLRRVVRRPSRAPRRRRVPHRRDRPQQGLPPPRPRRRLGLTMPRAALPRGGFVSSI